MTSGTPSVEERDVVWANVDGTALNARIYRPSAQSDTALPVFVDVHGGAWSTGDRTNGVLYDRAIAAAGFVVVAIDFRQAPAHRHPAASRDVVGAVRWVRANARALGVDGERLGLIGSSSGGHLALLAATRHAAAAHRGTTSAGADGTFTARDEIDARVAFVVALWPVSDPFFRYRYAKRAGIARLVAAHDAYYDGEATMREASVPRLVTAGEADDLPPTLVVQPGEDGNVPVEMTFDLLRAWQSRGGKIEYAFFPDMPHAFGHADSPATRDMIRQVVDFARRRVG